MDTAILNQEPGLRPYYYWISLAEIVTSVFSWNVAGKASITCSVSRPALVERSLTGHLEQGVWAISTAEGTFWLWAIWLH
jgi:hypothetical protein